MDAVGAGAAITVPALPQLFVAGLRRANRARRSTLLIVRQESVTVVSGVLADAVAAGGLSDEPDIPLTASALSGSCWWPRWTGRRSSPSRASTTCARRCPGCFRARSPSGPGLLRGDPARPGPAGPRRHAEGRCPWSPTRAPAPSLPPARERAQPAWCDAVPPPRAGGTGTAPGRSAGGPVPSPDLRRLPRGHNCAVSPDGPHPPGYSSRRPGRSTHSCAGTPTTRPARRPPQDPGTAGFSRARRPGREQAGTGPRPREPATGIYAFLQRQRRAYTRASTGD